MVPILILSGLALAALACSPLQKPPSSPPPPAPPPKDPEDLPLTQEFGDDEKARWLHLQLKLAGVKDGELDRGCPVIQYPQEGFRFNKILGTGDRRLQPCELYEFTLDRYEDPKFRPLAEELAGRPIPWALDDHDPKTKEDAELRLKIQKVIQRLDALLRKRGLKPGQTAYQEGLAVGLMAYLTVYRENFKENQTRKLEELDQKGRYVQQAFKKLAAELESLGLGEFWRDLENQGGMGPTGGNYTRELTALEAMLSGKEAECTERSKISYAVFRMAGLDPTFLYIDPSKSVNRALELETLNNPDFFHVAVGLNFNDKIRIFDSSLVDSAARHPGVLPLSLRQYLAMDVNNRGGESKMDKDFSEAEANYQWARRLDPSSEIPSINLADLWVRKGDPEKALEITKETLNLYPQSSLSYFVRGLAWEKLDKLDETFKDINHAISLNSKNYKFYIFRGTLFLRIQRVSDAERDFVITLQLAPRKGGESLLNILVDLFTQGLEQSVGKVKLNNLEEETGLVAARAIAGISVASYYWRAGHRESAMDFAKQLGEALTLKKQMLGKEKKEFSPAALDFLKSLYQIFPRAMKADPEFKALWDPLGLKF